MPVNPTKRHLPIAKYYLSENRQTSINLAFDPGLPHAKGYWHLASIKYPKIIKEFTRFVQENYKQLQELKNRYNFAPQ